MYFNEKLAKAFINDKNTFLSKDWQKMKSRKDIYNHLKEVSTITNPYDLLELSSDIADIMFIEMKPDNIPTRKELF